MTSSSSSTQNFTGSPGTPKHNNHPSSSNSTSNDQVYDSLLSLSPTTFSSFPDDMCDNNSNTINGKESWNYPLKNAPKTVAMFAGMMLFGMNDSSLGVLIKSVSLCFDLIVFLK